MISYQSLQLIYIYFYFTNRQKQISINFIDNALNLMAISINRNE